MKIRCGAQARTTGEPCRKPPLAGGLRCRLHGGASPQAKAKALVRKAEAEAEAYHHKSVETAQKLGVFKPSTNPLEELQAVAGEVVAVKEYLQGEVEKLREIASTDDKGTEQVKAVFAAYERALDRTVSTLAVIAKLNIDERLAKIDQATALVIIRAVEATLAELGIAGPAAERAKQSLGRHLRIIRAEDDVS